MIERIFKSLETIDRRIIYLFVALSLSIPIISKVTFPPAEMKTAESFYDEIEKLEPSTNSIVLVSLDWGPNTIGESKPQSMIAIEHLLRNRIPFALITIYSLASPFLDSLPKEIVAKLEAEMPGEKWEYGVDWVNWGFRPSAALMIQGISKAADLPKHLVADAYGTPLTQIPVMNNIKTIRNISKLIEITSLSTGLAVWIQFFQGDGYRPPFLHACTSISIPEAYIYYSSGQLVGLLNEKYPDREVGQALLTNSSLAFAHIIIIAFILLGNIAMLLTMYFEKRRSGQ